MQAFGQRRAAVVGPLAAVALAATLFLLIAISVAVQPPDTSHAGLADAVLLWTQTLAFAGGALVFAIGAAAFVRRRPELANPNDDEIEGSGGDMPSSAGLEASPPVGTALRFTLIAVGKDEDDARAIADFSDPRELVHTLRDWRWQHPDEELRIFGPTGREIARWPPTTRPTAPPATVEPRLTALV